MAGKKANTTTSSRSTGEQAHSIAASKTSSPKGRERSGAAEGHSDAKNALVANPQADVDRSALREDIMKRFPTIRAALAK